MRIDVLVIVIGVYAPIIGMVIFEIITSWRD